MKRSGDLNVYKGRIGPLFDRNNPIMGIFTQKPRGHFAQKGPRIIKNLLSIKL
jgi:hypothetical protein